MPDEGAVDYNSRERGLLGGGSGRGYQAGLDLRPIADREKCAG